MPHWTLSQTRGRQFLDSLRRRGRHRVHVGRSGNVSGEKTPTYPTDRTVPIFRFVVYVNEQPHGSQLEDVVADQRVLIRRTILKRA